MGTFIVGREGTSKPPTELAIKIRLGSYAQKIRLSIDVVTAAEMAANAAPRLAFLGRVMFNASETPAERQRNASKTPALAGVSKHLCSKIAVDKGG